MTQQEENFPTRRAATRAPVKKPVQLHFDDSVEIIEGICQNISIGGMFIEFEHPRPPTTLVRFELPVEKGSICGLGEVVWMRADSVGKGREAGMGIKFRHLEQRDRQLIFKMVSEHIKERLARRQALTAPFALPDPIPRKSRHRASDESPSPSAGEPPERTPEPALTREDPSSVDDPSEKPLHRAPETFIEPPLETPDPVDKTLRTPVQPELFEPLDDADPVDKTLHHTTPAEFFDPPNEENTGSEWLSGSDAAEDREQPEHRLDLELDPDSPTMEFTSSTEANTATEEVASAGWPHVEQEAEFDPASRPSPKRDFPVFPVVALLLLLLSAGIYLLRGSLASSLLMSSPTTSETDAPQDTPGSDVEPRETIEPQETDAQPAEAQPATSSRETPPPRATSTEAEPDTDTLPQGSPRMEDEVPPFPPVAPPREATPDTPPRQPQREDSGNSRTFFTRLVDITWNPTSDGVKVVLTADGQIPTSRYKHFRLSGGAGPREVIRLLGVKRSFGDKSIEMNSPVLQQIRTGYHRKAGGNELHVVLDLKAARYQVREISNRGNRLEITIR